MDGVTPSPRISHVSTFQKDSEEAQAAWQASVETHNAEVERIGAEFAAATAAWEADYAA